MHDGALDKLHYGVAAVLELRVAPQTERPWGDKHADWLSVPTEVRSYYTRKCPLPELDMMNYLLSSHNVLEHGARQYSLFGPSQAP